MVSLARIEENILISEISNFIERLIKEKLLKFNQSFNLETIHTAVNKYIKLNIFQKQKKGTPGLKVSDDFTKEQVGHQQFLVDLTHYKKESNNLASLTEDKVWKFLGHVAKI